MLCVDRSAIWEEGQERNVKETGEEGQERCMRKVEEETEEEGQERCMRKVEACESSLKDK